MERFSGLMRLNSCRMERKKTVAIDKHENEIEKKSERKKIFNCVLLVHLII